MTLGVKEKIVELENRNLIVYVDPARLMDIAVSLSRQKGRELTDDPKSAQRELIHCELHDGPISIWFRLPSGYPS